MSVMTDKKITEAEKEAERQAVRDRIDELSEKLGISHEDMCMISGCIGYAVQQAFLGDDDDQEPEVLIATPTIH